MIIELPRGGRIDGDLCCPYCQHKGLWQPADHSPCFDDWWCKSCRSWTNDTMRKAEGYPADECGPYPRMKLPPGHRGPSVDLRQLVPACG